MRLGSDASPNGPLCADGDRAECRPSSDLNETALDPGVRRVWRFGLPIALVCVLGVLWFAAYNPINGLEPGTDSGVYLYIGQQMRSGAVPYRDIFDNKGPLLYGLNALGLTLGGGSLWGVYTLEFLILAAGAVLGYLALARHCGRWAAAIAILLWILLVAKLMLGNHEEEWVFGLQFLALYLVLRRPYEGTRSSTYGVIGLLGAGAFLLKPVAIGFWIALLLVLLLMSLRDGRWRRLGVRVAALAIGAGAGLLAALVYLLAGGALSDFFADYFAFNFLYAGVYPLVDHLASIVAGAGYVGAVATLAIAALWLLALLRLVRSRRRAVAPDLLLALAVVWMPVEVLLASVAGRDRVQYYLPWLIPIALLVALTLSELHGRLTALPREKRLRDPLGWAVVVLVVLAFSGTAAPTVDRLRDLAGSVLHYPRWSAEKAGEPYRDLVGYIDSSTAPDDRVLVWSGYSADVNFLAERSSPTRYAMQLALYSPTYGAARVREFLADLKRHPPAMIIDASPSFGDEWGQAVPPLDSTAHPWEDAPAAFRNAWDEVFAYLQAAYREAETLPFYPNWIVYLPRPASGAETQ